MYRQHVWLKPGKCCAEEKFSSITNWVPGRLLAGSFIVIFSILHEQRSCNARDSVLFSIHTIQTKYWTVTTQWLSTWFDLLRDDDFHNFKKKFYRRNNENMGVKNVQTYTCTTMWRNGVAPQQAASLVQTVCWYDHNYHSIARFDHGGETSLLWFTALI